MPQHYSHMVVSRLSDVGAVIEPELLAQPDTALASDVIALAVAAGVQCVGLLFSHSPVIEATLALASSAT